MQYDYYLLNIHKLLELNLLYIQFFDYNKKLEKAGLTPNYDPVHYNQKQIN